MLNDYKCWWCAACVQNGALYTVVACVTGCPCFYSCFYRSKMRQQYLLHESPCGDCLVHCFCESCALCQEYRELKNRGFDMSIGNKFNLLHPSYSFDCKGWFLDHGISRVVSWSWDRSFDFDVILDGFVQDGTEMWRNKIVGWLWLLWLKEEWVDK